MQMTVAVEGLEKDSTIQALLHAHTLPYEDLKEKSLLTLQLVKCVTSPGR